MLSIFLLAQQSPQDFDLFRAKTKMLATYGDLYARDTTAHTMGHDCEVN